MLYDTPLQICRLPSDAGLPTTRLEPVEEAWAGEMSVYARRYWDAVQAGSRVDLLLQVPLHREWYAGQFALYRDHVYSVEQIQHQLDADSLPITVISLKRLEDSYDIAKPD